MEEKKESPNEAAEAVVEAAQVKEAVTVTEATRAAAEEEQLLTQATMSLEVAYESLEVVRKLNLQAEFGETVDMDECTQCLKENNAVAAQANQQRRPWRMPRRRKRFPCLTCGSQVCPKHRSDSFQKQNIAVCNECAPLFSVQYILKHVFVQQDVVTDAKTATVDGSHKQQINQLLEIYDRSLLILKYSVSFMEDIAAALEKNTSRHNRIGVGTSATGVFAGVAGVAAAATILTPVGPPLLLASILFGGTSTAVTAGSEAVNYRAEPNVMADRILTLHGVLTSIFRLPSCLDNLEDELEEDNPIESTKEENQKNLHYQRTIMNVVRPLTAGALSAVSIVTEGREMRATLDKIKAGNPCEKANMIRDIHQQVNTLPETQDLARYIQEAIARRQQLQELHQQEEQRLLILQRKQKQEQEQQVAEKEKEEKEKEKENTTYTATATATTSAKKSTTLDSPTIATSTTYTAKNNATDIDNEHIPNGEIQVEDGNTKDNFNQQESEANMDTTKDNKNKLDQEKDTEKDQDKDEGNAQENNVDNENEPEKDLESHTATADMEQEQQQEVEIEEKEKQQQQEEEEDNGANDNGKTNADENEKESEHDETTVEV